MCSSKVGLENQQGYLVDFLPFLVAKKTALRINFKKSEGYWENTEIQWNGFFNNFSFLEYPDLSYATSISFPNNEKLGVELKGLIHLMDKMVFIYGTKTLVIWYLDSNPVCRSDLVGLETLRPSDELNLFAGNRVKLRALVDLMDMMIFIYQSKPLKVWYLSSSTVWRRNHVVWWYWDPAMSSIFCM